MATTCTKSTAVSTATTSSSTSGRSREGTRGPTRRPMTSFSASGPGPGSLLIPTGAVIFSLLSYGVALRRPESGPTGQQRPPAFSSLLLFKAPETGPLPRSNVVRPLHASERHTAVRSFLLQVGHSQRNATRTPPHTVSAGRRHTAATRWLRDGVPIEVVSTLLGHSSVSVTSSVYGHLTVEDARAALEKAGWLTGREVTW